MPGNQTQYFSNRLFLPIIWQQAGITANQSTGLAIGILGTSLSEIPFARRGSLVAVGIVLDQAVTAGLIRFEITVNGGATGKTFDMNAAAGLSKIWEFEPGQLVGVKGDRLGFLWGSSASLLPTGVIETNLFAEVQWA